MPIRLNHGLGALFVDADWLAQYLDTDDGPSRYLLLVGDIRRELKLSRDSAERLASAMIERARLPSR